MDCDIWFIKDIENEKINKLKDNIKCLEDMSNNLEHKINELKSTKRQYIQSKSL